MKFNSVSNNDEQAMIQNNMLDLELLKERMKVFLEKSTLLFYSHVFDMSIQRQDEYKVFGQSNTVVMKFNHLFKIEKRLLDSDDKISNAKLSVMSN
jgi:adenylate cyclase 10